MTQEPSLLTEWAQKALGLPEVRVQVRLRGNHLHILCEGDRCPRADYSVAQFSQALAASNIESLLPDRGGNSRIYKIFVCGRALGDRRNNWTVKLDTNGNCSTSASFETEIKSDSSSSSINSSLTTTGESRPEVTLAAAGVGTAKGETTSVLTAPRPQKQISHKSIASNNRHSSETEDPEEIAAYLSEVLGGLGISVKVKIEENYKQKLELEQEAIAATNFKKSKTKKRLWVICEASYSPDPSLLAEPVAQQLRELKLKNFREASILLQVRGEAKPDWMLRVDLTPSKRILNNYARWGDVGAIERLLQEKLTPLGVALKATRKESTLHLFCSEAEGGGKKEPSAPDKDKTKEAIAPFLSTLNPQGIKAATIYGVLGQKSDLAAKTPIWVDWLNLPASQHPDLEPSALTLAKSGNNSALHFLLDRLLNPDLDRKLETGGIKAIVLPKADLLHVMTEAPTCPSQSKVAQAIADFLRKLQLREVKGVRVYGRRAGQKLPLWRYSADFTKESPSSVEQAPEFAASVADGQLAVSGGGVSLELPGQQEAKPETTAGSFFRAIQQLLVATRVFVPAGGQLEVVSDRPRAKWVALVWAILGAALAVQIDLFLGKFLQLSNADSFSNKPMLESAVSREMPEIPAANNERESYFPFPDISWKPSGENPEGIFNESGFTKAPNLSEETSRKAQLLTIDYPTFNSKQLDEQLASYQDFILANKRPPDVLIVGSSRALRGIEPAILEERLEEKGYPHLQIYNLGINGATVRVVDLILRQVLPPQHLPRLILFADGVRAFNSGREDRTFEIIASSDGYRAAIEGELQAVVSEEEDFMEEKEGEDLFSNYEKMEEFVNGKLEEYLVSYRERDRLKNNLASLIKINEEIGNGFGNEFNGLVGEVGDELVGDAESKNNNGFLPISVKFEPEIYYQKHSKVSGEYDADYNNFKLSGQQTIAFENLLHFTQARRVKVVFVNLPLTKKYLDAARMRYELKFREYMQQMALEYSGLSFLDLSLSWPQAYENFSDPSHLNRYGAVAVAEELAEEQSIPWPQLDFRF